MHVTEEKRKKTKQMMNDKRNDKQNDKRNEDETKRNENKNEAKQKRDETKTKRNALFVSLRRNRAVRNKRVCCMSCRGRWPDTGCDQDSRLVGPTPA